MDIGAGILLSLWTIDHFGLSFGLGIVCFGIFAALFPDFDTFTRFLPKDSLPRRIIGEHRGLLHRPAFYLVLCPIVFFFFGSVIGTLFTFGVFYHLVHDTFFLGSGIKWLWPLSQKSLSLFHDIRGKFTTEVLYWAPYDDAIIESKYMTEDWVRVFYFRPGLIAFTEYPTLIIALILLYLKMQ